jgi:hypothetical protein
MTKQSRLFQQAPYTELFSISPELVQISYINNVILIVSQVSAYGAGSGGRGRFDGMKLQFSYIEVAPLIYEFEGSILDPHGE